MPVKVSIQDRVVEGKQSSIKRALQWLSVIAQSILSLSRTFAQSWRSESRRRKSREEERNEDRGYLSCTGPPSGWRAEDGDFTGPAPASLLEDDVSNVS